MAGVAITEFRVLGPVQALAGDRPLPLGGPKQRALLAELLLHDGALVPRDQLVDALWGDEPPPSATSSLQVYVHGLRRVVGAERIETNGSGYRIRVEPQELDVARFRRLLARAERSLRESRPADAAEDLESALLLWKGPALADIADQPVARTAVPRLEELRLRAIELRNDAALALGAHESLVSDLERLVAAEPYRERLREQLILALYRAGRQKEALDAYRAARHALVEELGVEPGPALQELERKILQQDPRLAAQGPAPLRRSWLPAPPTPLVGRRLELAAVEALVRREDVRLVTLTGAGGTGKTRLALAVAGELARELRDGAVFVDLSATVTPELVLPEIGRALDLSAGEDVLEQVRDRSLLVVLDNLEQLVPAVTPVSSLLAAAPRLRVLATSRVPLRLSGEHEYRVPGLPVPGEQVSFEELVTNEAVRLFAARAQAVEPSFALDDANVESVASICRRLDGLPLAIELAAARTRVLPPDDIEARLAEALELLVEGARDLPPRQQTLRATLDWSYELLAGPERALLAQLSVFAGGWTLEHAEAILGGDVLRRLESLVDGGLVRRRERRFSLLETIREYGGERLAARDDAGDVARRHALHFLEIAEHAWEGILAGGDAEESGFAVLDAEQDNLRAALAFGIDTGDLGLAVRLAGAHRWYWLVRARYDEGRRVFERLAHLTENEPSLHAPALAGSATFATRQGETAVATERFDTAIRLYRELGDLDGASRCVSELGAALFAEGDVARAVTYFEEALALFEELGNDVRRAATLSNLAAAEANRGRAEEAAARGGQAIAIQREIDDTGGLGVSLANLSRVDLALGDLDAARRHLGEALEIATRLGYELLFAYALGAAGELAARDLELEDAARLVGASAAHFARLGMPLGPEESADREHTLAQVRSTLGEEQTTLHVSEGGSAPFERMLARAIELTR